MDLIERNENMPRRHPWEISRYRFFAEILKQSNVLEPPVDILDVGSGDAWFSKQLAPWLTPDSHVTCWDKEEIKKIKAFRVVKEDVIGNVYE